MEMEMEFLRKLPTPQELKEQHPVSAQIVATKAKRDDEIRDIFEGKSDKLILVIGPCSADNEDAVIDYISRLRTVQEKVSDKIFMIPRIYTNKPRTTGIGYKGMLHQPDPEKKPDPLAGIIALRHMHIRAIEETGMTAADQEVANMLLRSRKPVVLAVNKADQTGRENPDVYEFYNLGLGDPISVSALHGHGTGDLLDAVCAHLDFSETVVEEDRIPVAIIGRPNVGKSSLTNRILGENRMIVANEAGTTRDAIDTPVDNAYGKFIFTDTAGLRKRSNITDGLERYMVVRALAAVERSRVALILVDATVGFTEQDSKVAGYAHDQGKACIIVVNKWDAVEGKETNTMELQRRGYAECFSFMGYAPIIFISAQTGYNVNKLMQLIRDVDSQNGARVPTGVLNEMLARATARMQPPSDKGRRLKIFYLTQASTRPPTFVAFVNAKHLFHFSYQRYIINQIRENFGLEHTPIRLVVRERGSGEVGAKDV